MANKLFIGRTPEGYSLSLALEDTKEVTQYNQILRRGTFTDLVSALKEVPEEVYIQGVKVNFGSESSPIKISDSGKNMIGGLVAVLEQEAFHNFLNKLVI
jgi:hypothetical protein